MRARYFIASLIAMAMIFQGCGLKGPLRLPDKAQPAPQSQPNTKPDSNP